MVEAVFALALAGAVGYAVYRAYKAITEVKIDLGGAGPDEHSDYQEK